MSRNLLGLLFITLCGFSSVSADLVAITWNGSPTGAESCGACEYPISPGVYESTVGSAANVTESDGGATFFIGAGSSGGVDTPFTVSAETLVELSVTADYAGYGSTCPHQNCDYTLPTWTFSGEFSGGINIVDADGNSDLYIQFGQSGSVAATC